jgi:hypothetical protein
VIRLPETTRLDAAALCTFFFVDGYVRARGGQLTLSMPRLDPKEARRLRRHFSFADAQVTSAGVGSPISNDGSRWIEVADV